jgi:hypothetical protein
MDGDDLEGLPIAARSGTTVTVDAEHMEANLLPCNAAVRLQARTRFLRNNGVIYGENH